MPFASSTRFRLSLACIVLITSAAPAAHAGSLDQPEIVDRWKDVAFEPGGVEPGCQEPSCDRNENREPGDLGSAWVGPENTTTLQFNIHVNATPEAGTLGEWTFTFHWNFADTPFEAWATMDHDSGILHCGGLAASCALNDQGEANTNVELQVLKESFGGTAAGGVLTSLWVKADGRWFGVAPEGVGASDRAPDSGFGKDYAMAGDEPKSPEPAVMETASSTPAPASVGASTAAPAFDSSPVSESIAANARPSSDDPPTTPGPAASLAVFGLALAVRLLRRDTLLPAAASPWSVRGPAPAALAAIISGLAWIVKYALIDANGGPLAMPGTGTEAFLIPFVYLLGLAALLATGALTLWALLRAAPIWARVPAAFAGAALAFGLHRLMYAVGNAFYTTKGWKQDEMSIWSTAIIVLTAGVIGLALDLWNQRAKATGPPRGPS